MSVPLHYLPRNWVLFRRGPIATSISINNFSCKKYQFNYKCFIRSEYQVNLYMSLCCSYSDIECNHSRPSAHSRHVFSHDVSVLFSRCNESALANVRNSVNNVFVLPTIFDLYAYNSTESIMTALKCNKLIIKRLQNVHSIKTVSETIRCTVEPLFYDHPQNQIGVVVKEGWSSTRGLTIL